MTNSEKNIIAERYLQETPEDARLVSGGSRAAGIKQEPEKPAKKRGRASEKKAPGSSGSSSSSSPSSPSSQAAAKRKSAAEPIPQSSPKRKPRASAKKPETTPEEQPSVKTPSVMKLVEDKPMSENQVIAAGKSRIPRQLRGIEPLSKVIRREADAANRAEMLRNSPEVRRNLTEMIIEEKTPEILRRFNACDCEQCCAELTRRAASELPARYIKLPELAGLDYDGFSREERLLIKSLNKTAVMVLIRIMISNKKRNFHE